jgi:anti-sigma factor RsiW
MSCSDFEILILESLDGSLSVEGRAGMEAHLAGCTACRAFLAAQRSLDAALMKGFARPALSTAFRENLRRRIALEEAAPKGSARRWVEALEWPAYGAAALAGLAVLGRLLPMGERLAAGFSSLPFDALDMQWLTWGLVAAALGAAVFTVSREKAAVRFFA